MAYDQRYHRRRSIRLQGCDYSQEGAYFITICARDKACVFGKLVDGQMLPNDAGQIVAEAWQWLAAQYGHVELDEWVVMPNHLHGIIVISYADCRGGSRTAPTGTTMKRKPLGQLIGAFKTVSTKRINDLRSTPGVGLWQRNYYEHIIRNEESLNRIRQYNANNPLQWELDRENPVGAHRDAPLHEDEPWRI